MFWNLSSAEVSLHNSIFDLYEDFDSKEDFLLYFVAIQHKVNRFQKTAFHKKNLTMIILAFTIENLGKFILAFRIENFGKFTFWTEITGLWDSSYKERWL